MALHPRDLASLGVGQSSRGAGSSGGCRLQCPDAVVGSPAGHRNRVSDLADPICHHSGSCSGRRGGGRRRWDLALGSAEEAEGGGILLWVAQRRQKEVGSVLPHRGKGGGAEE
jgi:hypothetical protein